MITQDTIDELTYTIGKIFDDYIAGEYPWITFESVQPMELVPKMVVLNFSSSDPSKGSIRVLMDEDDYSDFLYNTYDPEYLAYRLSSALCLDQW